MEIVAGGNACCKLPVFIAVKMELTWQSTPVGKVNADLLFLPMIVLSAKW